MPEHYVYPSTQTIIAWIILSGMQFSNIRSHEGRKNLESYRYAGFCLTASYPFILVVLRENMSLDPNISTSILEPEFRPPLRVSRTRKY